MHILIVADGRSPITRHWVHGLLELEHKVTLISTFPCSHIAGTQATHILPVAFAQLAGSQVGSMTNETAQKPGKIKSIVAKYRASFQKIRYHLAPITLLHYGRQMKNLVEAYKPDVVHALRLPFEGMLASFTPKEIPLVVSIWGNDLTLHSTSTSAMQRWTRRTLKRADGLIADVNRDLRLSRQWGFEPDAPTLVAPTSGGVDLLEIHHARQERSSLPVDLPENKIMVINPRGLRPSYVRNDIFFQSIPLVIQHFPDVYYVCPSMAGQPEALQWVEKLGIQRHVGLLPYLNQQMLWELFFRCAITISITIHDGTPNTLLEAMACGTFPIAGDLESLREWITPGINGLLIEPDNPEALANATLLALESDKLRAQATEKNLELIRLRAETNLVQSQLQVFYQQVIQNR